MIRTRIRSRPLALWLALTVATHLVARDLPAERRSLFSYDGHADLQVRERGVEKRGHVMVRDVSFESSARPEVSRRINAYIVIPDGAAPHAGIMWCHWLGEPATSNRSQYLDEAVALAQEGVVSVLVDAMWSDPKWYAERKLDEDFQRGIEQVVAFRRGLDLLFAQANVDPSRVAFVGHDYSAMYGAITVAVDSRVRAAVFIAAAPRLADWAFFVKKPTAMDAYVAQNAPLEIRDYLLSLENVPVLLQFAGKDRYVPTAKAREFADAVPEPKTFRLYDSAEHDMSHPPEIRTYRDAWLSVTLKLGNFL